MIEDIEILCLRVNQEPRVELPRYMSLGASGMDVVAAILSPMTLKSLERALIPTGWAFAIPPGFEIQIRPRSGLAYKHGVTCLNTPGTIDSDYRGEVKVLLVNLSSEPYTIMPGERIAQLVVAAVNRGCLKEVQHLDETARGAGGFGHTGKK